MMGEADWIRKNIKQRTCTLFSSLLPQGSAHCKCLRQRENHPNDCTDGESHKAWTTDRNTESRECETYGSLVFEKTKIKIVRMDVQTDMACIKHLLFNVWNLPKPEWILTVIGELCQEPGMPETKEKLKDHMDKLLKTHFAGKQNIWITTEGIQHGVSAIVGQAVKDSCAENITPFGLFSWGSSISDSDLFIKIKTGDNQWKINEQYKDQYNAPSELFTHQIFSDDGSFHPETTNKSYQEFKSRLETHLAESDTEKPVPYIIVLWGGWSYIIDGVRKAIDTNTPIIIMKGSGGYADVLANLLEKSRPKSKSQDSGTISWTGTVSDELLREQIRQEIIDKEEKNYKEGERILLQCLQKRELLTVFDVDKGESLLDAVIEALFKSRETKEMIRILDFYMPAKIYSNRGTASTKLPDELSPGRDQGDEIDGDITKSDILERFFLQALRIDNGESVEFIIDYDGLPFDEENTNDLLKKLHGKTSKPDDKNKTSKPDDKHKTSKPDDKHKTSKPDDKHKTSKPDDKHKTSKPDDKHKSKKPDKNFFRHLFLWSVSNNKQKCASVFWKKGENLLMSALQASSVLSEMIGHTEDQNEVLEHHRSLFEQRVIGLINQCYKEDKERTMALMERQSINRKDLSDASDNHFSLALEKVNRKIFATDAYKEYIRRVWYGKIRPFEKETKKSSDKR